MTASAMGNRAPAPRPWMPRNDDELPHLLRQAAQRTNRAGTADTPNRKIGPPTEHVRQLAVDRSADGRGEQVRREGPRVQLVAVQVGDDARQGGADHGLVEGGEEDADHDRAEDAHPDRMRQLHRGAVGEGRATGQVRSTRRPPGSGGVGRARSRPDHSPTSRLSADCHRTVRNQAPSAWSVSPEDSGMTPPAPPSRRRASRPVPRRRQMEEPTNPSRRA